jgi:uncharacterized protein YaaQ
VKLVITIIQDTEVTQKLNTLTENGFSATKLASTGGFLKAGNTTLLIGVDDHKLESLMQLLEGATVFVLNVERFERI